jgi:hypothetical protein
MHARGPDPAGAYFWANTVPLTFTVTVSLHGNRVASASFHRMISRTALADQTESLQADGFVGEFLHPAATSERRPVILVLGGSEGGLPGVLLPAMLASSGYPALGVAYFGEPGLPKTLSRIPLEYFAKALNWRANQGSTPRASRSWASLAAARPASAGSDRSYAADHEAEAVLWPHLLHFLDGLAARPAG